MVDHTPKPTRFGAVRKWCGKLTRRKPQDQAVAIDDFLTRAPRVSPPVEVRPPSRQQTPPQFYKAKQGPSPSKASGVSTKARRPQLDISPLSSHVSTPYDSPNVTVMPESKSNLGFPEHRKIRRFPRPEDDSPSGSPCAVMGPDDYYMFRTDMHPIEMESIPVPRARPISTRKPVVADPIPVSVKPAYAKPPFKRFTPVPRATPVSTQKPVPVKPAYVKPPFKPSHGKSAEKVSTKVQASPAAPQRQSVHYIPPILQTGYFNGVPPALQARHSMPVMNAPEQKEVYTAAHSRKYSYPLVDFKDGLFLNADMSENSSPVYQDPRIPKIDFADSRGLEHEVYDELTKLSTPSDEKEVVVSRPNSQAWASPARSSTPQTTSVRNGRIVSRVFNSRCETRRCHSKTTSTYQNS